MGVGALESGCGYSSVPVPEEVDDVDEGPVAVPQERRRTFWTADVVVTASSSALSSSVGDAMEGRDRAFGELSHEEALRHRHGYVQNTLLDTMRRQNGGSLGFGVFYSDHMLTVSYDDSKGWSRPVIGGLEAIRMHPAAQVLHYGMSCFEGMKVYRDLSGAGVGGDSERAMEAGWSGSRLDAVQPRLLFFRPELNLARFVNSARRLHLPSSFCTSELLELLRMLVRMDAGWVPGRRGESLYLRPVLYSATEMLGVSPPKAATLNVIMSPSGDYFGGHTREDVRGSTAATAAAADREDGGQGEGHLGRDHTEARGDGARAIRLLMEEGYTRAWVGGAGDAKVGGNYAPTIYPQWLARESYGVDQVVYTRGGEIEECGAMNIFFVLEGEDGKAELVTPSLGQGTILPGVTRASIIEIARVWSERGEPLKVCERSIGVDEVVAMGRDGRLREVFACGTASVIQPVGGLVRRIGEGVDEIVEIQPQDSSFGKQSLTRRLYDTLVDIQHGLCDDPRFADWTVTV